MPTLQFLENGRQPPLPLPHCKQLINHLIDGLARTRPESVWVKIPRNQTGYEEGYRKLTYKLMANAINGLAHCIEKNLGRPENFKTLTYFGPWDPRYVLLLLGAVKAGYKVRVRISCDELLMLHRLIGSRCSSHPCSGMQLA